MAATMIWSRPWVEADETWDILWNSNFLMGHRPDYFCHGRHTGDRRNKEIGCLICIKLLQGLKNIVLYDQVQLYNKNEPYWILDRKTVKSCLWKQWRRDLVKCFYRDRIMVRIPSAKNCERTCPVGRCRSTAWTIPLYYGIQSISIHWDPKEQAKGLELYAHIQLIVNVRVPKYPRWTGAAITAARQLKGPVSENTENRGVEALDANWQSRNIELRRGVS